MSEPKVSPDVCQARNRVYSRILDAMQSEGNLVAPRTAISIAAWIIGQITGHLDPQEVSISEVLHVVQLNIECGTLEVQDRANQSNRKTLQ